MPRKPRYYLAGVSCHVIQRRHNREPCFMAPNDFRYYLQCLRDACLKVGATVHAYVLMTNHVHPSSTAGQAANLSNTTLRCWTRAKFMTTASALRTFAIRIFDAGRSIAQLPEHHLANAAFEG